MILMKKFAFAAILGCVSSALAQSTMPSATAPSQPRRVVIPPGFEKVQANGRTVLVEPADREWVQNLLPNIPPSNPPATNPSSIVERINAQRETLTGEIAKDLAIDPAAVAPLFDEILIPEAKEMADFHPPMVYFVTTKLRTRDLLRDGWQSDRFYYNRAADDFSFRGAVQLSPDAPADETLIPAFYEPNSTVEQRQEMLKRVIEKNETEVMASIARNASTRVPLGIVQFLGDRVFKDLNLKSDQAWLGLGMAGYLASKHSAPILGMEKRAIVDEMVLESPRAAVKAHTVDLANPLDPASLRQDYVMAYLDAMRRKATMVVEAWVSKAGDDAIPKMLAAIRASKPADGAALIKLIHEQTGVDLTPALKSR